MFGKLHQAIDAIRELPGVRHARRVVYERRFASQRDVNHYHGIYSSFEAAAASAPHTKSLGYDNPESAAMYDSWTEPFLADYPAMFWLQRLVDEGMRSVFDLGGHIGIKYYAFIPRMVVPSALVWTVCDVPAVTGRGLAVAEQRDARSALRFTTDWRGAAECEILFASGSLQYLPQTLGEMLSQLDRKPRAIVLNTTAIHPTRSFFTLNSIGTAFCPYRVQREADFTTDLSHQGYTLRDRWETPKDFRIPFHRGHDLDRFVGYCFQHKA